VASIEIEPCVWAASVHIIAAYKHIFPSASVSASSSRLLQPIQVENDMLYLLKLFELFSLANHVRG
jgi:hypothetical protein